MNLEEELNMINDLTTTSTTTSVNPNTTLTGEQLMTQSMIQPTTQPMTQAVDINASQRAAEQFNMGSLDFDINSQNILETNPLVRLSGQQGEVFRIHLLPNAKPKEVLVHWDQEKGHNFICLAQAYNTAGGVDVCCGTHGTAKRRFVVPVIVIPSNRGQVVPNSQLRGELKVLIVSGKGLQDLKDQAEMSGSLLEAADIIATVKDTKYKSFNFAINTTSFISQVVNVQDLQAEWTKNSTNENVVKACGRLITRVEYEGGYSNYDYNKYKQNYNTPTQAQPMYGQPMQPPMYSQPMQQPMYGQPMQPQQGYGVDMSQTNPYNNETF